MIVMVKFSFQNEIYSILSLTTGKSFGFSSDNRLRVVSTLGFFMRFSCLRLTVCGSNSDNGSGENPFAVKKTWAKMLPLFIRLGDALISIDFERFVSAKLRKRPCSSHTRASSLLKSSNLFFSVMTSISSSVSRFIKHSCAANLLPLESYLPPERKNML
eukprot:26938_5